MDVEATSEAIGRPAPEPSRAPEPSAAPGFDRDAYDRFKIPRKLGEAISGWDDPEMVGARAASDIRDDDYVIGLVVRERPRAYPVWIIDNYHVVNDRIDGERFIVVSCERCQSGSAFWSEVPGSPTREPLFRSVGFLNATLILKDGRTGSHWIHWEGYGLDRRAEGVRLPWIPTYHMEWADWVRIHPDTEVMVPPADPTHPDARHGHGREEFFSRPGIDPVLTLSIVGPLDDTYPENEMVLAIEGAHGWSAYPLREAQREGGVVHGHLDAAPLVVFAGPRPDGFTMAAFSPFVDGRELSFERVDGVYADRETGSRWTIEGLAVDGPLAGRRLEPVRGFYLRWHALIYSHRNTRVFRSARGREPFDPRRSPEAGGPFGPVLSALAERGHDVRVLGPIVTQRRPRESQHSLAVTVDGDRINLHRFSSEVAARDYVSFEGAWSGLPLRTRALETRARRIGGLVLESDPAERFVDPAHVFPIPPRTMRWSPFLESATIDCLADEGGSPAERSGGIGFRDLIRAIRLSGFEVLEVGFLPPGQLRVGCTNGIALMIEAERFLLYRFGTAEQAASYAAAEAHAFALGPFVLRSTPDTMYLHQLYEICYVGEERVRWSPLLENPVLRNALRRAIDEGGS